MLWKEKQASTGPNHMHNNNDLKRTAQHHLIFKKRKQLQYKRKSPFNKYDRLVGILFLLTRGYRGQSKKTLQGFRLAATSSKHKKAKEEVDILCPLFSCVKKHLGQKHRSFKKQNYKKNQQCPRSFVKLDKHLVKQPK